MAHNIRALTVGAVKYLKNHESTLVCWSFSASRPRIEDSRSTPLKHLQKVEPRWLWHAIDHHSGTVLAYVFGRRKDAVFLQLQALLEPFGITRFYTDGWGAYERHIAPEQHHVGKENTQKIESKHINLRTRIKRLVRRTICFSKTTTMHDLVIGLFINRYEFGAAL
jgi:insertion element IS1 protein InsB